MWRARNLRCEFDDFYGDAVPGNADDLEKRLTNDCHLEGQSTPTESKLKRIKQIEPAGIKLSKQPKKLKRLQKNAAKQEEAKQRCEKAMHLQKQTSFDRLHKEPMDSSLFAKPLELENDSKTSLISTQEISSKENGLNDKIPSVLYKHPVSVNRSFNKFFGYMGHCTVLTDTPIIEGSYYTEVTILPSKTLTTNTQVKDLEKLLQMPIRQSIPKLQSSVRVGIAKRSYKLLTPLGGAESYCYNGKDGNLIHNRSVIPDQLPGDSFAIGDVIGVYFHMEPPLPTDKSDKTYNNKNDGSVLTFLKNGTQLASIRDIDQGFYVFGVSLYNWANVEINEGPEFKYLLPKDAKPYSQIRKETLLYKDLKFD